MDRKEKMRVERRSEVKGKMRERKENGERAMR